MGPDLADISVKGGLRAACISPAQDRHGVPTPHKPFKLIRRDLLNPPAQIQDVSEIHGILAADKSGPSWETIVAAVILNIFPLVTVFGILAFQLDRHAKRG
jgi:hypothetical protein